MSEPSSTSSTVAKESGAIEDIDADITLNIQDDEAEIARLQLRCDTNSDQQQTTDKVAADDDDRIPKIQFHCSKCDMKEMVHYYGQAPPFVSGIKFVEDTFVMRDPFQPPPPRWKPKAEYFIALGAKCVKCENTVCKDAECSFYYTATYCLTCARQNLNQYPVETQTRLRKQLASV